MTSSKFPYAGSTHCALRFAHMKNKPVSAEEVRAMFPTKFNRPSRVVDAMDRLTDCGLLSPVGTSWKITNSGINYLKVTARAYKGVFE